MKNPDIKRNVTLHVSIEKQNKVLEVIKDHVGKPCPTNAEMAEIAGLSVSDTTSAISSLYANHVISRKVGKNKRVLIINATKLATAPGTLRKEAEKRGREEFGFNARTKANKLSPTLYRDVKIVTRVQPAPKHSEMDDNLEMPYARKCGV